MVILTNLFFFGPFLLDVWPTHSQKCVLLKNNTCFSCLGPLVKMDIIYGQNKHFGQIEPFKGYDL
jgi:hypothetical protein